MSVGRGSNNDPAQGLHILKPGTGLIDWLGTENTRKEWQLGLVLVWWSSSVDQKEVP